jgi:hypothetical protein
MEDQNAERLAFIKEKDALMKEYQALKQFIPEFEQMEKAQNKLRFMTDMRERLNEREYINYIQQYLWV